MISVPSRYSQLCSPIKGGFGNAVVCQDNHLEREVVIKQINDPLDIDRLYVEIEALLKAKSKHVVEIYDVIKSDDEIAIVEEFLIGDDLVNFRASNNIYQFIQILYQLSCGLSDIHDCKIVHRDFKPNNVKYDKEDLLKIFDFGLAKYKKLPGSTKGLVGTFGFMAPELFHEPPIIDKPVDVYAFGASAFYLVLGETPECARQKPLPRALLPEEGISNSIALNKKIADLIDSCLEIDPDDRPLMRDIKGALMSELLHEKHKATIVHEGQVHFLEEVGKGVKISRGALDSLKIYYDGYNFRIQDISGDVYVNEVIAKDGQKIEGSSVIILGNPSLGGLRKFVTFDISHPEVII